MKSYKFYLILVFVSACNINKKTQSDTRSGESNIENCVIVKGGAPNCVKPTPRNCAAASSGSELQSQPINDCGPIEKNPNPIASSCDDAFAAIKSILDPFRGPCAQDSDCNVFQISEGPNACQPNSYLKKLQTDPMYLKVSQLSDYLQKTCIAGTNVDCAARTYSAVCDAATSTCKVK